MPEGLASPYRRTCRCGCDENPGRAIVRAILLQSNVELLRGIQRLRETLVSAGERVPDELDTYYSWTMRVCEELRQQVTQTLDDLQISEAEAQPDLSLIPDLLSKTQKVTRRFAQFNQWYVSPVLRTQPSDRMCLKLLRWLHSVHKQTQPIPAALSDGDFASWPVPPLPTVYFMPTFAQSGLLYLPLFFHEFGHLLYACHEP